MLLSLLIQRRTWPRWATRLAGILIATLLTSVGARLTIELPWVPVTLQVLGVLFAGLALGPGDGAASQILYLGLIAIGFPVDAGALGPAALLRPSAGYLFAFVPAAYVTGWLSTRWSISLVGSLLSALAGVAVIYAVGVAVLTLGFLNGDWATGFSVGVAPFLAVDAAKAVVAATLARGAHRLLTPEPSNRSGADGPQP